MGRPAGSPNKSKQALIQLLQERYPGYQPVLDMAEAAIELTKSAREADAIDAPPLWRDANAAHDRVAQYITPKLKAVDLSAENPIDHYVVMKWAND